METVRVLDKEFKPYLSADDIQNRVSEIANKINADYSGESVLFVSILNGSFMFTSDLMKKVNIDCEVSFLKVASYSGVSTTGDVKRLIGLNESIEGRDVIIIEDIVDTGITIEVVYNQIRAMGASSVRVVSLFMKPAAYRKTLKVDYVGFEIPNDFIVGYGLDYNGYGRNLPAIYSVVG